MYVLVSGSSKDQLVAVINKKMEEGYTLQGGICVTPNVQHPMSYFYVQAMVAPASVVSTEGHSS